MIASLGMYDEPWLADANDAIWAAISSRIPGAPPTLDRSRPLREIWRDPALLLAQTCGWPLLTELVDAVTLVATPMYGFPGCDGPYHRSWIVVRADDPATRVSDLRGRRAAINGRDSNTGMNLLRAAVAPFATEGRFFGSVTVTGGHLASLHAVATGLADVAAIDCVSHGLVARHRTDLLAGTRVLGATPAAPGLPFVMGHAVSAAHLLGLRHALRAALADPATEPARMALGWIGLAELSAADYAPVTAHAVAARALGMDALA